ncbi:transaldolase [Anaeramoeba ignava]|uniref:Transaldolase n=1 Tax=Anaeramoeba ignava TaxID=1746090 RepID=A0A9Q0RCT5_ANAIG|nr:transaldolase [Anaeramoeba ignava]|eukprot:Anaeramoba_ignava/a613429_99.p1 GENE.a613429_99~~a613429_99.p1  ORF type:complete len:323 (-),score=139.18 a613429_99:61-1029(-)
MISVLDQLKKFTTVVADTGDFDKISEFKPQDSTTNPTLILLASKIEKYKKLILDAIDYAKKNAQNESDILELAMEKVAVNFGLEILKIIPGRVSTEIDARMSFDTEATIKKAKKLIKLYEEAGIKKERILLKIATTWEGINAAEQLEKEGIHTNLTLLFNIGQAIRCAEAGVTLISPFVGRIRDWYYKKEQRTTEFEPNQDPGVRSVTDIFNYFKKFGYSTEIMGASFRNIGEIIQLAGCDLLTISPGLLAELKNNFDTIEKKLDIEKTKQMDIKKVEMNEKTFREMLEKDQMATEKLEEGIRVFSQNTVDLENMIKELMKN